MLCASLTTFSFQSSNDEYNLYTCMIECLRMTQIDQPFFTSIEIIFIASPNDTPEPYTASSVCTHPHSLQSARSAELQSYTVHLVCTITEKFAKNRIVITGKPDNQPVCSPVHHGLAGLYSFQPWLWMGERYQLRGAAIWGRGLGS